jgi:hypothetical protein
MLRPEVHPLVDEYLNAVHQALPGLVAGFYVVGSAALGDFRPYRRQTRRPGGDAASWGFVLRGVRVGRAVVEMRTASGLFRRLAPRPESGSLPSNT